MSALSPGLYRAKVRGIPGESIVMAAKDGCTYSLAPDGEARECYVFTDARPLIVLDIQYPAALVKAMREGVQRLVDSVADQIIEQTKPARIPEPRDLGSLVRASQVGECDGSERVWVRFSHARTDCWIDSLSHQRSWSDLSDPEPYPFGGLS